MTGRTPTDEGDGRADAAVRASSATLFAADPGRGEKLLAVGEKPNDATLDRAELAAGDGAGAWRCSTTTRRCMRR